jgi:formylglycine-generating enzyme
VSNRNEGHASRSHLPNWAKYGDTPSADSRDRTYEYFPAHGPWSGPGRSATVAGAGKPRRRRCGPAERCCRVAWPRCRVASPRCQQAIVGHTAPEPASELHAREAGGGTFGGSRLGPKLATAKVATRLETGILRRPATALVAIIECTVRAGRKVCLRGTGARAREGLPGAGTPELGCSEGKGGRMPNDGARKKVRDPPGIYPAEVWDWYECYHSDLPGKLTHDAMLYLAEAGVRHLATLAYSIACQERCFIDEPGLSALLGRHLSFGAWVDVLRICAPAVPGWDFSRLARGQLPDCGRLATVSSRLDELIDVDTMKPIREAMQRTPKKIDWWTASKVLVEYRNKTLGHPNARILKTDSFHNILTEIVAAAVCEFLWNDLVAEAAAQYREAWFSSRTTGKSYEATLRASNRIREHVVLSGDEGEEFLTGDQIILSRQGELFVYRCRLQDPQDATLGVDPNLQDNIYPGGVEGDRESFEADAQSPPLVPVELAPPTSPPLDSPPSARAHAKDRYSLASMGIPFVDLTEVVATTFAVSDDQGETHDIEISGRFFVAKYPVTQLLYERIMQDNPSRFRSESHPVEFVSWVAAVSFCNKLSAMVDLEPVYESVPERGWRVDASKSGFRLLMEDEWAYCCSVGYNVGTDATPLGGSATTFPVDAAEGNRLGLHCMLGNVWEWCNDIYRTGYYSATLTRRIDADSGSPRVIRGGSFTERPGIISPNSRFRHPARARQKNIGFRIGRSTPGGPSHSSTESNSS